ncbi:hypothetical protein [Streptomyces sp. NPDC060184]|uniref:hypothetical protein n=1 Tax=Streptomyces sp. NPDC060184 TaxID=3347064 RepID=UPI003669A957
MRNNMRKGRRTYGGLVAGLVALAVGLAGCSDGDQDTGATSVSTRPTASATASPSTSASESPTATASPSATPSEKPVVEAAVGSYGGWNLAKAVADARAHHVASVTYSDASELHRSVVHTSNWKVCAQSPSPGTYSTSTKVAFTIVGVSESCSNPPTASSSSGSSSGSSGSTATGGGSSSSGGSGSSGGGTSKSGGSSGSSGGSTATGGSATTTQVCSIRSNAGNCYRAGQFCRNADVGATTTDEAGRAITCGFSSGRNRWHY